MRQVGHGHDLSVLAQLLHQPTHGLCNRTAHARIHLVKNQSLRLAELAGGHRNGKRNARQLAAGCDLAYRPRRAAAMASDQKFSLLQAMLRWLLQSGQCHLKLAALHAQALHGLRDGFGQQGRRFCAGFGNTARFFQVSRLGKLLGLFQGGQIRRRIEFFQVATPGRQQRCQFGRWALVTARQAHP